MKVNLKAMRGRITLRRAEGRTLMPVRLGRRPGLAATTPSGHLSRHSCISWAQSYLVGLEDRSK